MKRAVELALWQRLAGAGLVAGECPAAMADPGPWYVRAMLGVAGWIGSLLLFGFVAVAMSAVLEHPGLALAFGLGCCTAAYAIYRNAGGNDFASQFAFALSLAGQGLVAYAVLDGLDGAFTSALLLLGVFQAALAALMPAWLHRVWSSLCAGLLFEYAWLDDGIHGVGQALVAAGFALVWLNEARWGRQHELWRPLGYGLALALLPLGASPLWGVDLAGLFHDGQDSSRAVRTLVGYVPLVTAGVFMFAAGRILAQLGVALGGASGLLALAAAAGALLAAWFVPGLSAALLVLLVGFAAGNAVLVGLGAVAALGMLSRYYYVLSASLLEKSAVLVVSGVVLLVLRALLRRRWRRLEGGHA